MLRIGDVQLDSPLLLAPIARYCDLPFRLVVRRINGPPEGGLGLACTELLSSHAVVRENERSLELAKSCEDDRPLCMQLYGADADILAESARWAEARGAAVIDINMGCPVDKVTKRNGGSKLLCDPSGTVALARRVVESVKVPVTAKIRMGWDDGSLITRTLPPALADAGIASVTVHGRTTEQKFRPSVRLEGIADVVEALARRHPNVPVIGNGDVRTPEDARKMIAVTGCHGVMIGRGALSTPWIFRETAALLRGGRTLPPIPRPQRVAMVMEHFDLLCRYKGERRAVHGMRQRITWYSPHLQPWPGLRRHVRKIETASEFYDFLAGAMASVSTDPHAAIAA
ncbi:MAG: tRNA dihydrouridine synthase DusB [Phycisphaeraceae bacterium]|nr:tRNA dihydrouridine synthase DusB [Phycisphaeraceae bacterium]